jgi:beta-glucanase (GH16 family)
MTIKDFLIKTYLDILVHFRYWLRIKHYGKFHIPNNYIEVFNEKFNKTIPLSEEWDHDFDEFQYHPNSPFKWYDYEQVTETTDGLSLNCELKSKYFKELNRSLHIATSNIRSKKDWKYGIFKFIAKAPKGKYLWWALWLSGRWSWPPEIDIVESWSKNTIDCNKNKSITTNVYYDHPNIKDYGSFRHILPFKVTETFLEYTLWWEKDFIKVYYNGYLVFKVTNRKILDGMFESQRIVLTNSTEKEFTECISPLIVKSVKVYQKK